MNIIDPEEIKTKLDRGEDFKLVMAMGEWAFDAKHIPGSLNISALGAAIDQLKPEDEIVVYCAGKSCFASVAAYQLLEGKGYGNVRRYLGGLEDWEAAGYPLEGNFVEG